MPNRSMPWRSNAISRRRTRSITSGLTRRAMSASVRHRHDLKRRVGAGDERESPPIEPPAENLIAERPGEPRWGPAPLDQTDEVLARGEASRSARLEGLPAVRIAAPQRDDAARLDRHERAALGQGEDGR